MRGGWRVVAASIAVLALLFAPGQAAAQTQHWSDGDVRIHMANPGLEPQDDGAVHVGGDFYGQAVLTGNDSDQVAEMGFSFGTGPTPPEHSPIHPGLQDFRTDDTPEDGWVLPITASDTPAGEYTYALHAYTVPGDPSSEIARLWGSAVLEDSDITPPWPWILPGETQSLTNPYGVNGVTIEFAENATAQLWVDGEQVELSEWTPPERDDDNVPRQTVEEEKRVLGDGYQWNGAVEEGTTLRVQATDENGNENTKAVLVGVGVDAPVLEVSTNPISEEASTSGDGTSHRGLTTTVTNWGSNASEARVSASAPDPWAASVSPTNLSLEPGESTEIHVEAEASGSAADGAPAFEVAVSYTGLETPVTSTFTLGEGSGAGGQAGGGTNAGGQAAAPGGSNESVPGQENGSPIGLAAGLAALAAAALARRRRA